MAEGYNFDSKCFDGVLNHGDVREIHFITEPAMAQTLNSVARQGPVVNICLLEDMLAGLHYLHSQGLIHHDIRPENIGVNENPAKAVILDLGSAVRTEWSANAWLGTDRYLSPEMVEVKAGRSDTPFSEKADVWALGITCLEFLTEESVGWEYVQENQYRRMCTLLRRVSSGTNNEIMGKIVEGMISWSSDMRLTAAQALAKLPHGTSQLCY